MLDTFKKFLADEDASTMYITGIAGTGKTTSLAELVEHCKDNKISNAVVAYTHKACNVLASKLPRGTNIMTLHAYLKKRPFINNNALRIAHVDENIQVMEPDKIQLIFIDEFSMVGEKDYLDLVRLMRDEITGAVIFKVVFIGDPNQLPPVKDQQTIIPKLPYWVKLTKVHRQADGNPLIDTLIELNEYINGKPAEPLEEHSAFSRGKDIVELYRKDDKSKIILAYTNQAVQDLNATIEGKETPEPKDVIFSPTSRKMYTLHSVVQETYLIQDIMDRYLELDSKFKTLETLHTLNIQFYHVIDEEGNESCKAGIFGHQNFLDYKQKLAKEAVDINKAIETQFGDPKEWSKVNWSHPMARARGNAWKNYLSFNDNVFCFDFPHAMTVHKSQGSTYDTVYLDMVDLGRCADSNYKMYLKLLYVAISRAAKQVFTN